MLIYTTLSRIYLYFCFSYRVKGTSSRKFSARFISNFSCVIVGRDRRLTVNREATGVMCTFWKFVNNHSSKWYMRYRLFIIQHASKFIFDLATLLRERWSWNWGASTINKMVADISRNGKSLYFRVLSSFVNCVRLSIELFTDVKCMCYASRFAQTPKYTY